ncbi:MAG: hypothetical protein ACOY40_15745 [Bacillota bacterium]
MDVLIVPLAYEQVLREIQLEMNAALKGVFQFAKGGQVLPAGLSMQ